MESSQRRSACELIEAAVETGLGLAALSAEWLGKFLDEVTPKLSPVRERGARLMKDLREKGRGRCAHLGEFASGAREYLRERTGLAANAEVEALKQKVACLEQELERLKGGGSA